jgi:hypothetical protein
MKNEVSYLYIGQNYYGGKFKINVDNRIKKIGHTTNPVGREKQLSRTNSPIKMMYLKLWKFDGKNTAREVEHRMIHPMLCDIREEGCEWFFDEDENLEERLTSFLDNLTNFSSNIEEVNIEDEYTPKEKQVRNESILSVFIDDNKIDGKSGNKIFVNSLELIGLDNALNILPTVVTKDEFIGKSFNHSKLINEYWINLNYGNEYKKKYLEKLFKDLQINGRVNLI